MEIAPTGGPSSTALGAAVYDVVLLDVRLPDMDGLDAIPKCRELAAETPVIVMTAHGTRPVAIDAHEARRVRLRHEAVQRGGAPCVVARALDRRRLQQQDKALLGGQGAGFEEVIGQSEPLRRVLDWRSARLQPPRPS